MNKVAEAAKKLVKEGFLLKEDEDRIIKRAAREGVDLWVVTAQALP